MKRSLFLKALLSLPFGGYWAKRLQSISWNTNILLNKFYVAGFQYYDGPSIICDIQAGERLTLMAEPGNSYDKFAVAIYREGVMLGYVPRTDNKHLSRLLQQDVHLQCRVSEVNSSRETWKMLKVAIEL